MKDRMLAISLHLFEQSLCPCGCGQVAKESHNPRMEGWYTAETTVCYARAALDQLDDNETRKRERGELRWAKSDLEWGRQP